MILVELVLLACLVKDPSHCETFHVPFAERMNPVACVWQSQFRAAEWAGHHPDWKVRRFTCQMPGA